MRQRAVSSLGRLPASAAVTPLIDLARTNQSPAVKKQAVQTLTQIKDPRVTA